MSRLSDGNLRQHWRGDGVRKLSCGENNAGRSSDGVGLLVSCWIDSQREHIQLHTVPRRHICVVCGHGVHTVCAREIRARRGGPVHRLCPWEIFAHDQRAVTGGMCGLSGGLVRGLAWRKRVDPVHAVLPRVVLSIEWGNLGRPVHVVPAGHLRHGSRERDTGRMPTVCCGEILAAHWCNNSGNVRRMPAKHVCAPAGIQRVHAVSRKYIFPAYWGQLC